MMMLFDATTLNDEYVHLKNDKILLLKHMNLQDFLKVLPLVPSKADCKRGIFQTGWNSVSQIP